MSCSNTVTSVKNPSAEVIIFFNIFQRGFWLEETLCVLFGFFSHIADELLVYREILCVNEIIINNLLDQI